MTLNGVMALISRYFTEFGSFRGALRKSGWRCRRKKFTFAISSPDEFHVNLFDRGDGVAAALTGIANDLLGDGNGGVWKHFSSYVDTSSSHVRSVAKPDQPASINQPTMLNTPRQTLYLRHKAIPFALAVRQTSYCHGLLFYVINPTILC